MGTRRDRNDRGFVPRWLLGAALVAIVALCQATAAASEESVDEITQSALALDAHPTAGALLFHQQCARCHGPEGHGNAAHEIPCIANQRFAYLVRQLADMSGDQRESMTMHRVLIGRNLRDPQAWVDVAAWLSTQSGAHHAQEGDGRNLALGAAIFREQCASCHRADARGDDDGFVPSLRNQHYAYLVTQLNRIADGARHNVDENLIQFFRSLDADEISGVADYLSRLSGPVKDRKTLRNNGVAVD
jgi:cytochrome c553